jgi:hypothetical protein
MAGVEAELPHHLAVGLGHLEYARIAVVRADGACGWYAGVPESGNVDGA